MEILLDNSVLSHAVTGTKHLGGVRNKARPGGRLTPDIKAFEYFASLARSGKITCYTSLELEAEALSDLPYPLSQEDCLDQVKLHHTDVPIDRTKFGLEVGAFLGRCSLIEFCERYLLKAASGSVGNGCGGSHIYHLFCLSDFEKACIKNISIFRYLCDGISRDKIADAFHYWTAIEGGLSAFCTNDVRFQNAMTHKKRDLGCRVLRVSEVVSYVQNADK